MHRLQAIQGKLVNELPDPDQYKGKRIRDTETGQIRCQ